MNELWNQIVTRASEPTMWAFGFIVFLTGIVRGFSGFGTGMMMMSAGSALIGPAKTLVVVWFVDSFPSIPIVIPAFKKAELKLVGGLAVAALVTISFGVYALTVIDPIPVRWMISAISIAMVVLLWCGWRYRGQIKAAGIAFVGGLSGFLYGLAALPGPPVILYMMGSGRSASLIRANLLAYMFLTEVGLGASLYFLDLFSLDSIAISFLVAPLFLIGAFIGSRMFGMASEKTFRNVAYALIVMSALTSLPILDDVLRGG